MNNITSCRICKSTNLQTILNLGNQALTGVFPKSTAEDISKGSLELIWCEECQLVQLKDTFDLSEMYGDNYGYRSGLNQSMVAHLNNKIHNLEAKAHLEAGDCVIDIGSNDATSLKTYQTAGIKRIGVDPTGEKFKEYYTDDIFLIPDFFPNKQVHEVIGGAKVKIITSIAMFYNLEHPIEFVQDIHDHLDIDGIWHFEQSYMPSMLRLNSYDTICHEHIEYYSLFNIKYILDKADMRVVDVQMNGINGGSFAVTAARKDSSIVANDVLIDWLYAQELKMGFDTLGPFQAFEKRVYEHKDSLKTLIDALNSDNKKILGYGASTKGNVVLQFCDFTDKDIATIAEVNPDKYGCHTPGTNIPIVSEKEALEMNPDYFLVLPWHFKDGIVRREQEFLKRGGKLIFPFPEIEIIGG